MRYSAVMGGDKQKRLKVVPLKTREAGKPNRVLVDTLGKLYQDAKNGEIQAVAYIAFGSDNSIHAAFSRELSEDGFAAIGALEHLKLTLRDQFIEDKFVRVE